MTIRCFASVADICCMCFSCFRSYVVSVSSKHCKSRFDVAHVATKPVCCSYWGVSCMRVENGGRWIGGRLGARGSRVCDGWSQGHAAPRACGRGKQRGRRRPDEEEQRFPHAR
jgi:hypothetical protein